MPQPTVATDIHQPLNVHRYFAPQVSFDAHFLIDDVTQPTNFLIRKITDAGIRADPRAL
jgi:hypothetical protein